MTDAERSTLEALIDASKKASKEAPTDDDDEE